MDEYIRKYRVSEVETCLVDDVDEFNNKFSCIKENFKIFSMNIRSISENLGQLLVYLRQFRYQFDVIVLTETFRISNMDMYSLPGYSTLYNGGNVNKNDGVVVYIKSGIRFGHKIVPLGSINLLQITLNMMNKNIIISAVYRLHPVCVHAFNDNLHKYLKTIKKCYDYSVFLGDININILDKKDYTQDYLNILQEEGYISQINTYTRIDGNRKSCIDHIFVKQKIASCNLTPVVIQSLVTDHYPTLLLMNFNFSPKKVKEKFRFNIDFAKLKRALATTDWNIIYEQNSIEDITNNFLTTLKKKLKNVKKT